MMRRTSSSCYQYPWIEADEGLAAFDEQAAGELQAAY